MAQGWFEQGLGVGLGLGQARAPLAQGWFEQGLGVGLGLGQARAPLAQGWFQSERAWRAGTRGYLTRTLVLALILALSLTV